MSKLVQDGRKTEWAGDLHKSAAKNGAGTKNEIDGAIFKRQVRILAVGKCYGGTDGKQEVPHEMRTFKLTP